MPLFVMDSVSFASLPRINAEDVSYVAIAGRIAEMNTKLDIMNNVISENTARGLHNEECLKATSLIPPQIKHKYSSAVVEGSKQPTNYRVPHMSSPKSSSTCQIGGISPSRSHTSTLFKMPHPRGPPPTNMPRPSAPPINPVLEQQQRLDELSFKNDNSKTGTHNTGNHDSGAQTEVSSNRESTSQTQLTHSVISDNNNNNESTAIDKSNFPLNNNNKYQKEIPQQMTHAVLQRSGSQMSVGSTSNNTRRWDHVPRNNRNRRNNQYGSKRVHGTAVSMNVKGASKPNRQLFISRVGRDTADDDMRHWIENLDVNIIDFERLSHDDARNKSYLLTVSKNEYFRLFDPRFWPANIVVTPYVPPKASDNIRPFTNISCE